MPCGSIGRARRRGAGDLATAASSGRPSACVELRPVRRRSGREPRAEDPVPAGEHAVDGGEVRVHRQPADPARRAAVAQRSPSRSTIPRSACGRSERLADEDRRAEGVADERRVHDPGARRSKFYTSSSHSSKRGPALALAVAEGRQVEREDAQLVRPSSGPTSRQTLEASRKPPMSTIGEPWLLPAPVRERAPVHLHVRPAYSVCAGTPPLLTPS